MRGCIIGGSAGFAGYAETTGATYTQHDDGSAEVMRTYQGPSETKDSFLAAIPEGTPDSEYSTLTRTKRVSTRNAGGWTIVTLTFGGVSAENPQIRPFRITKNIVERPVTLFISPGFFVDERIDEAADYDFQYTTLAHTLEYTESSDNDEAHQFEKTELPPDPDDAVFIATISPTIKLLPTEYLGGKWNPPAGRTPILTAGAAYQIIYQPIEYSRSKDRGQSWNFRETWAAIILRHDAD